MTAAAESMSRCRVRNRLIKLLYRTLYYNTQMLVYLCYGFIFSSLLNNTAAEYVRKFEVSEGVPIGTKIGYIGDPNPGQSLPPQPPYLIVPVPGSGDTDLKFEEVTGEIKTKVVLDREVRDSYSFVAIPQSGENIKVIIDVKDENDNAPTFAEPFMLVPFPENTPRDVKKTLAAAIDKDLGLFNTQRYIIVSGNTNNAFRLSSHREDDGVLYLDLQVNGFLDRETIDFYSLLIEAWDEGSPPKKGSMVVNVTIQDMNDNQPIFNQSRYFATILENSTIGTPVLQALATDIDAGGNAQITYSINRRQSDRDYMFQINPKTGIISVNRPLDFEEKEIHELVVVAKDSVEQPHETTAFVSVRVIDVNDNQPTINLIFLSDDVTPKISEDAQPGEYVARISVNDPDSKEKYSNVNVTLEGGFDHFNLDTEDNTIYLLVLAKALDREEHSNFSIIVFASDNGHPPLHASRKFQLIVTDINDNAPEFDKSLYQANVLEVADPGTSVFHISAKDRDEGKNSAISYSLKENLDSHPSWFTINPESGLITTKTHIDCETDPQPEITVIATDSGDPAQSSSTTVKITIRDVNDNEPIFDQSFYNVSVQESEAVGACILKVSATDPDCGVNALVNYTFGDQSNIFREFSIRPVTGDICVSGGLDFEIRRIYEIPVVATDRGGLSTTAMIKIHVEDVNDNAPTFYPKQYNVSLRESHVSNDPVVVIVATDRDSGVYGQVNYEISSGNEGGIFRLNERTGELFVVKPLASKHRRHVLKISARDGAGVGSIENAIVSISINDRNEEPPIFDQPRYSFNALENAPRGTPIGTVRATSKSAGSSEVLYSIYSGDPEQYFSIDERRGSIKTSRPLDHETKASILLNVLATAGNPPTYGHTQVNISVIDVNDNAPEFDVSRVKISVPEDTVLHESIYAPHAVDLDSARNGRVSYSLTKNPGQVFRMNKDGILMLQKPLDYESIKRYSLVIRATDDGSPPRFSSLALDIEVQDVNDNSPVFEKRDYFVSVLESEAINSEIVKVKAVDSDTGNNARLTYGIRNREFVDLFGIFPNSGSIYLKKTLDRETRDRYVLTVVATDNGIPVSTASTTVSVTVLDSNDNDPVFSKKIYEFTVEEGLFPNSHVGFVKATDLDSGVNSKLSFYITSGSMFKIDRKTGEIKTTTALDRENRAVHKLEIEVRDGGSPQRRSRATVQVIVTDVNDNAPIFVQPIDGSLTIREDVPVGSEIFIARATDLDEGNNASVTYKIINDDVTADQLADTFYVNSTTGSVITTKMLDYTAKSSYILQIQASDSGNPPKFSVKHILIKISDYANEKIHFLSSSFTFEISERAKIGSKVGVVRANSGFNRNLAGGVSYSIINGNENNSFDINKMSGQVFTSKDIDYETNSQYRMQVKAIDLSSVSPMSSLINVEIEVIDVNDQTPSFREDPVTISIQEDAAIGSTILNFTAVDLDSGPNGEIKYSLVQQSPKNYFTVNPLSGVMTLMKPLDYEEIQEFVLVLSVTDNPVEPEEKLWSSLTVKVNVEDVNDNSPIFVSQTSVEVPESLMVGEPVLYVQATDKDSGDNGRVVYEIKSGNVENSFEIDFNTGILSVAKFLDRESLDRYSLNIIAKDNGKRMKVASQTVEIVVLDVNDNAPKFNNQFYTAEISENSVPGSRVITVAASDADYGVNGNVTYVIPSGIGDSKFRINSDTGEIRTIATLNREEKDKYDLVVYAKDGGTPALYATATVLVSLTDVNDHKPEFRDSCYPLQVPENTDLTVIHTVLATDSDSGLNGEVTYSIISGNSDNKFNIDSYTGELSSKPLDRETRSRYYLSILAEDRGVPRLKGYCNMSITVLDQNDNDPIFSQSSYSVSVPENTPLGTTVLKIEALDGDEMENSRVTYSLSNETQWLFKIDNATGFITTVGKLDREKQSLYSFQVTATDNGKYDARTSRAQVRIVITDINDNRPVFRTYPVKVEVPVYHKPGKKIIQVVAVDRDQDANGRVSYSLTKESSIEGKFRIDSETGVITPLTQLSFEEGRIFYVGVIATDMGSPPTSSTGLVEVHVGDTRSTPALKFLNDSYSVKLEENARIRTRIVKVTAVRTDGRRKGRILYHLTSGNEYDVFELNSLTGVITVKDALNIDSEVHKTMRLTVKAVSEENSTVVAHTSVDIELLDKNDNAPKFTQSSYVASVWEGNSRGTYVIQVSATDDDSVFSNTVYDIIDGNHDNAFIIEPALSGIVKTNIVLDREIRDSYTLTIAANDQGNNGLSESCTLTINIVDINDNQPTFPPHSRIDVYENAVVGTYITTITANDVDTNPALTYTFSKDGGNPDNTFSIDKFNGKIILAKKLDYETTKEYLLTVEASDTAHTATTKITVKILDYNDNAPLFDQPTYRVFLQEGTSVATSVLQLKATDADSSKNAQLSYSLTSASYKGFYVDSDTGVLYTNTSVKSDYHKSDVQVVVRASDRGSPQLSSTVAVLIAVVPKRNEVPEFEQRIFRAEIPENVAKGSIVRKIALKNAKKSQVKFSIVNGNTQGHFGISETTGQIFTFTNLDREAVDMYELIVMAEVVQVSSKNVTGSFSRYSNRPVNSTCKVMIKILDINDNRPSFNSTEFKIEVGESAEVGKNLIQVSAIDRDIGLNGRVLYNITSGNELEIFSLDTETGMLSLRESLDYDAVSKYRLVIKGTDQGIHQKFASLAVIDVNVLDENDNAPIFPVDQYYEFIAENAVVGSAVFRAHANDRDKGKYGKLEYRIHSGEDKDKFEIDLKTGVVSTRTTFDYEVRQGYYFVIEAKDFGGKSSTVNVQINVESRDEFAPLFDRPNYYFSIDPRADSGMIVGQVSATDRDGGPHGRVFYSMKTASNLFKINKTSGYILLKRQPSRKEGFQLEIEANSGLVGTLKSLAIVKISIGGENGTWESSAISEDQEGGLASWAVALLVLLVLLLLVFGGVILFLYRRNLMSKKPKISEQFDTSFDTIATAAPNLSQYPPRYNEITHYNNHPAGSHRHPNTTSQLSEKSQSTSSGRGSADDDEEIRMINAGEKVRALSALREDNMSEVSANNTQEYLARLGIATNKSESVKGSQDLSHSISLLYAIPDDRGSDLNISNYYAKINEAPNGDDSSVLEGSRVYSYCNESQPSMTGSLSSIVHSEEELQGSYNWDYLLDWGPQYQPLAHVFSEIARLKDDSNHNISKEGMKLYQSMINNPPPLLTNKAPRSLAPVLLQRSNQMPLTSLPKSPISHSTVFNSPAMCPSFHPALSPLANRPSPLSPLMHPSVSGPSAPYSRPISLLSGPLSHSAASTPHQSRSHFGPRHIPNSNGSVKYSNSESELRL